MKHAAQKLIILLLALQLFISGCAIHMAFPDQPDSSAKPTQIIPNTFEPRKSSHPVADDNTTLSVVDFLPLEQTFYRYFTTIDSKKSYTDVQVEYIDTKTYSVQHRIISETNSDVEVLRCQDGKMIRTFVEYSVNYTHDFTTSPANDDEVLLMEPIAVGTSWRIPFGTRTITAVSKNILVRAGLFKAVEVRTDYADGDVYYQYYLPGMGLLAVFVYDKKGVISYVQETSFRDKGLAANQSQNVYFADLAHNRILATSRLISLGHNPNIGKKLLRELRNTDVEGHTGLLPVPPDATIIDISIAKDAVSVSFSPELLSSAMLDKDGLDLMLKAIALTFADYYYVKKCTIIVGSNKFFFDTSKIEYEYDNAV